MTTPTAAALKFWEFGVGVGGFGGGGAGGGVGGLEFWRQGRYGGGRGIALSFRTCSFLFIH